jgi:FixJ family two-component response regulator
MSQPTAQGEAGRVTPPGPPKLGEGRCAPPLVFVVDDDPSVRRSLANLLESGDYAVETFGSAVEFLRHAEHPGASCLVLDVRLPGLDGLSLQRHLAERGRGEQIIFITGHGDIPMGVQAMKRGAVDFLPKPFGDEQLLDAVARALARSAEAVRARGELEEIRARLATLTPREFEVFRLVIAGLLNKQIGAELGAALTTIKIHRSRVFEKLGVVSVAELTRLAQKAGINPAPSQQAWK